MENKFTKNKIIAISVVTIIIILGVLFYKFKSNTKNEITENAVVNNTTDITNPVDQKTSSGVIKNNTSLSSTENDKNFNTAMTKAQTAFVKSDYGTAIDYYNQALKYKNTDLVYSGMFNVYSAQSNWPKALEVLDKAISLNQINTDYWKWKITLMDERMNSSFTELKDIYTEGFNKSLPKSRINLVVYFAKVSENNGQKLEAIKLWQKAMELSPDNKNIYQTEIDRLNK